MLKIRNISRILAVSLVITGFFAGPLLPRIQSSSCCGTSDNCCCCVTDETEPVDGQSANMSGVCGCEITESEPAVNSDLMAQIFSKPQFKTENTRPQFLSYELLNSYRKYILIKSEPIRNLGPPIFISNSSLLI